MTPKLEPHTSSGERSLFSKVFGNFFLNPSNTTGLLASALMGAVIYLFVKHGQAPDRLLDVLYIVVGFYFGGATKKSHGPES